VGRGTDGFFGRLKKAAKKQRKDLDGMAKSTYLCSPQKTENKQFFTPVDDRQNNGSGHLLKE